MDIILTMIKEDLITQETQTVYIYTKRLCIVDGEIGGVPTNLKDQQPPICRQKIQQITLEVEIKSLDGLNENLLIQIRSIDAANDIFLSQMQLEFQKRLSQTLSHETMNPLNSIISLSQMMEI